MKLYEFIQDDKSIFVVAENELQAREKAKIKPEATLKRTQFLNKDW